MRGEGLEPTILASLAMIIVLLYIMWIIGV